MLYSRRQLLDRASEILRDRVFEHNLFYLRRKGYLKLPVGKIGTSFIYRDEHVNELVDAVRGHMRKFRGANHEARV
jgi:hypothetical protein